ncbi:MAG: hypothetical protein IJP65_08390 [Bacteroidales bacterium]|nr:hypothetical protein [Bacteroidales bacterium]
MKKSLIFSITTAFAIAFCCANSTYAQDSYTIEQPHVLLTNDGTTSEQETLTSHLQMPSKYRNNDKTFSFLTEARLICNLPYDAGVPRKKAIICPSACDVGFNFSFGVQINDQFFIGGGFGLDWHKMRINYADYIESHGGNSFGAGVSYSYDDLYETGAFEYGPNAERIADLVFDFGILHRKIRTIMDFYADFRWEPDFASSVIPTAGVKAGFGFGGVYGFLTVHFVFRPFVGVMYKISDDHKIFLNLEYIPISNFKAHSLGITFGYKFK